MTAKNFETSSLSLSLSHFFHYNSIIIAFFPSSSIDSPFSTLAFHLFSTEMIYVYAPVCVVFSLYSLFFYYVIQYLTKPIFFCTSLHIIITFPLGQNPLSHKEK